MPNAWARYRSTSKQRWETRFRFLSKKWLTNTNKTKSNHQQRKSKHAQPFLLLHLVISSSITNAKALHQASRWNLEKQTTCAKWASLPPFIIFQLKKNRDTLVSVTCSFRLLHRVTKDLVRCVFENLPSKLIETPNAPSIATGMSCWYLGSMDDFTPL